MLEKLATNPSPNINSLILCNVEDKNNIKGRPLNTCQSDMVSPMIGLKPNESELRNKGALFITAFRRMTDDFQLNSFKIRSGQNSVGKLQLSLKSMEIFSFTSTDFDSGISSKLFKVWKTKERTFKWLFVVALKLTQKSQE